MKCARTYSLLHGELDPRAMEELDRVLESQLGKLAPPPRKVMGPDNLTTI